MSCLFGLRRQVPRIGPVHRSAGSPVSASCWWRTFSRCRPRSCAGL
ncbi:hypothetical protein HD593_005525 [Nonomuraea rubra]|uniref:Uncharacterized protein n=1 Tax=Nonomuraea rubra TaxID=46180 RepID=A0A7X0NW78_9ACTN|nr:hypothetical protein [Nonomuraea rubra]